MNGTRRVVIVGVGRVGRAVYEALPPEWAVVVVDVDADAIAALPLRMGRVDIVGDATSRLVLARCGLDPAVTVIAATGSDDANLEVTRLAAVHHGAEELVLVLEDDNVEGVPPNAVSRSAGTAAQVLNRVGIGELRGVSLGIGQGELRQVTVLGGSTAIGRPLRELRARGWLVAAVYRGGKLLIPHGETAVEASDQVLLVGDPAGIGAIAAFFRGGAPSFPTGYGTGVGFTDPRLEEVARGLVDRTEARELVELPATLLDAGLTPPATLAATLRAQSIGCLVVSARSLPWPARVGLTVANWPRQLRAAEVPILVVRGSPAFHRVLVAVGERHDVRVIGGVAIDLARQLGVPLHVLTVLSATAPSTAVDEERSRELLAFARLHGLEPTREIDRGNPVERIRHHAAPTDLLVIGHAAGRRNSVLTPDVSTFLLHDAPCATMFVPWGTA